MSITIEQLTEKIKTLPKELLENVFHYIDDISVENTSYKIPEWQKNEVRDRILEYEKNPESLIDFDDVMSELDKELNDC